ncbi:MAG: CPBP family intramembrane glutamic endopeptidase [Candidatus Limnocylindrales bacterium]
MEIGGILLLASLLPIALGLSSAAGYQVVAHARRSASEYRGPSPLILFGLQLVLANVLASALLLLGLPDLSTSSIAFLAIATTLALSYLVVVSLFVVRTGALSWRELGLPAGAPFGRLVADLGFGALTMLVLWVPITILAALLAVLLGVTTANVVPVPSNLTDFLLLVLGAAILIPIGEEVFFRGLALTAWLKDRGVRSALIRSTLFFALVHSLNIDVELGPGAAWEGARQALLTVAVIAPVGLGLGWLFIRRGLVAAIAGHATFNFIGVVLLALAQNLPEVTPLG